jgi:hypothetical protein
MASASLTYTASQSVQNELVLLRSMTPNIQVVRLYHLWLLNWDYYDILFESATKDVQIRVTERIQNHLTAIK